MSKKIYLGKTKQTAPGRARTGPAQQVRIIGGQWKRSTLPVLAAEGLRPTPDRVRETVFNWLNFLLDGAWGQVACLDLFAGSGALGFEAASRGAARVLMVEESTPAVRQLEAVKEKLHADNVTALRGDALTVAQNMASRVTGSASLFKLIFLDPPYHQGWLAKMLPVCQRLLAEKGYIYVESEQALECETPPDWMAGWAVVREGRAGLVFYHLLQRKTEA
jgi:16S rRNA (guanine966-N2)-methyltransferase